MITGVVVDHEAFIRLTIRGPSGREQEIEAVVDTGYTAVLSLPSALIAALGLRWQTMGRGTLADGSECLFRVYECDVIWDNRTLLVAVHECDSAPLVGRHWSEWR